MRMRVHVAREPAAARRDGKAFTLAMGAALAFFRELSEALCSGVRFSLFVTYSNWNSSLESRLARSGNVVARKSAQNSKKGLCARYTNACALLVLLLATDCRYCLMGASNE